MNKDPIREQARFAERILCSIATDQAEAIRRKYAALGFVLVARCAQCDRMLDRPDDPLSDWSRGDCAGCIVEFETDKPPLDLAPDELRAYVQPFLQADREHGAMIDKALVEAGPAVEHDMEERMVRIGMQRLIRDGCT